MPFVQDFPMPVISLPCLKRQQDLRPVNSEKLTAKNRKAKPQCTICGSAFLFSLFSFILLNDFFNAPFYFCGNLHGLHILVLFIQHRLQNMNLYLDFLYGFRVKRLVRVNQSHRNNGTSGFRSAFKASPFKFMYMVGVLGPGSFRKYQVLPDITSFVTC